MATEGETAAALIEFYAGREGPSVPNMPGKFVVTDCGSLLMVIGVWYTEEHRHQLTLQIKTTGEFKFHEMKRTRRSTVEPKRLPDHHLMPGMHFRVMGSVSYFAIGIIEDPVNESTRTSHGSGAPPSTGWCATPTGASSSRLTRATPPFGHWSNMEMSSIPDDARSIILAEARHLVGVRGTVRDYQCDCGWDGTEVHNAALRERFIVDWVGDPVSTCFNLEELRAKVSRRCTVDGVQDVPE